MWLVFSSLPILDLYHNIVEKTKLFLSNFYLNTNYHCFIASIEHDIYCSIYNASNKCFHCLYSRDAIDCIVFFAFLHYYPLEVKILNKIQFNFKMSLWEKNHICTIVKAKRNYSSCFLSFFFLQQCLFSHRFSKDYFY